MARAAQRRPYAPRLPPEARREQLLDAALAVIAREGYGGVSIEAIAREADVTRPVIYGVFDGLEPLLYALLDRQEERALAQLSDALPSDLGGRDPDEFLVDAVRRMVETVSGDPLAWRPILAPPEGTPPAVRRRIDADRELVRARIEDLLTAGLGRRGGPDIDAEVASHALFGVAEYFGRMIVEHPDRFSADRLVATARTFVRALGR
ncbi:MAG: TetR/AcrR family transcriptional regulator [Solirubrobacterales bacterium]